MSPKPEDRSSHVPTRQRFSFLIYPRVLIIAVIFSAVFFLSHFNILERFEWVTYDLRSILKGPRLPDPRLAVIEISDDSVARIGRWPWERDWHAALIRALKEAGARAIIFDILFSEPSDPAKDAAFSQAIEEAGNVYLAEVAESVSPPHSKKLLTSIEAFASHSKGAGHINLEPDRDGVMRRMPLVVEAGGKRIPQLSLAYLLDEYGISVDQIQFNRGEAVLPVSGGGFRIPLDANGNLIIDWAGRWKETFRHFSYLDVIGSYARFKKGEKPAIPLETFKNKICFVGTSAVGLFDIRPTPLEPAYPAVGVNLTVLDNLLGRHFIRHLWPVQNFGILFLAALVLLQILSLKNSLKAALATVGLALGVIFLASALFIFFGIWADVIYPLVFIFAAYFAVTLYNQISVTIERTRLLKLATRDALTGLYNIGHFKMLLKAEMTTFAMRREKELSLLMGDVDDFKHTNDTYGHLAGDAVLRAVASIVKGNCRALDVAARYGGEEFILMLPGAGEEEAFKIAEKIRKSVQQKVFEHEKGNFSTSISIGVTPVGLSDREVDAVIDRADRALYEAKRLGKNRVVLQKTP
ncbi:MAG: CHASE2 domain-containing protein [Candidatus Omnitrophica bacterium]|nr:CHASE2 domain-containing protein [Candidatus Omnitrophota bacterium]